MQGLSFYKTCIFLTVKLFKSSFYGLDVTIVIALPWPYGINFICAGLKKGF